MKIIIRLDMVITLNYTSSLLLLVLLLLKVNGIKDCGIVVAIIKKNLYFIVRHRGRETFPLIFITLNSASLFTLWVQRNLAVWLMSISESWPDIRWPLNSLCFWFLSQTKVYYTLSHRKKSSLGLRNVLTEWETMCMPEK